MGRCPGGASKASWAGGQSCAQVMSSLSSIITAKETGGSPGPGKPLSGHCFWCHSTSCLDITKTGHAMQAMRHPKEIILEKWALRDAPLGCTPCCKPAVTYHERHQGWAC